MTAIYTKKTVTIKILSKSLSGLNPDISFDRHSGKYKNNQANPKYQNKVFVFLKKHKKSDNRKAELPKTKHDHIRR